MIEQSCIFCKEKLDDIHQPTVSLTYKGCNGIVKANEHYQFDIKPEIGQKVHTKCRKDFCSQSAIFRESKNNSHDLPSTPIIRKKCATFNYNSNCIFCGKGDRFDNKKAPHKLYAIRTIDFQKTIVDNCEMRQDEWSNDVKSRIAYVTDLPAADSVYHSACSINFRTGKKIPHIFSDMELGSSRKALKRGRPDDEVQTDAFTKLISMVEKNRDCQFTIISLLEEMKKYLPAHLDPYSAIYLKKKLEIHFENNIVFSQETGKADIITFHKTASSIINDFYKRSTSNDQLTEKEKLISTVANLLRNDIIDVVQSKEYYPDASDMASIDNSISFIPDSLVYLLHCIFNRKNIDRKVASIGQAIMQAVRPRSLVCPLQLGLAVQLHHHFGSKFLIQTLCEHGFCSQYHEVQRFEQNAAITQKTDIPTFDSKDHMQYIADNVDHNLRTLDGHNTFHGMGIIAAITPGKLMKRHIPRNKVSIAEIKAVGCIDIIQHNINWIGLQSLKYEPIHLDKYPTTNNDLDFLWDISLHLQSPRPGWSGMMQTVETGDYPKPASIIFLPMIDLDPGNASCIYSTLSFISQHAKRYNITPIVTFDQPLYWKAIAIVKEEQANDISKMVIRLGGFHTIMSFLGAIGHIMAGSGLQNLLESIYSTNAVTHIASGKAYARAVRGHLLVSSAVNTLLTSDALNIPLPTNNNDCKSADGIINAGTVEINKTKDIKTAELLFKNVLNGESSPLDVESSEALKNIHLQIQLYKDKISVFPTAQLWLQYCKMVDILRRFIKAERTGDWKLHLLTSMEMLPFLAAAGHNLYTKTLHVYLQEMNKLYDNYPDVYTKFEQGLHVIRRSDRYWAGLSTDLIIEQMLMRTMKTTGGLTRGRGMEESQRLT